MLPNVTYTLPSKLAGWLHGFDRYDWKFRPAPRTPEFEVNRASPWVQAITMMMMIPVGLLIIYLTFEFIVRLCRCVNRTICCVYRIWGDGRDDQPGPRPKEMTKGAKFMSVLIIVQVVIACVCGFVYTSRSSHGFSDALEAFDDTRDLHQEVNQGLDRLLQVTDNSQNLMRKMREEDLPTPIRDGLNSLQNQITWVTLAAQTSKAQLQRYSLGSERADLEEYGSMSGVAFGVFALWVVCTLIVVAVIGLSVNNKCSLRCADFVVLIIVLSSWFVGSVGIGSSAAVADFCHTPADTTLHFIDVYSGGTHGDDYALAKYFLMCDNPAVNVSNPLDPYPAEGEARLVAALQSQAWADVKDYSAQHPTLDASFQLLEGNLTAAGSGALPVIRMIRMELRCPRVFNNIVALQTAACDPLLTGWAAMSLSSMVLCFFFLQLRCFALIPDGCGRRHPASTVEDQYSYLGDVAGAHTPMATMYGRQTTDPHVNR